MSVKRRDNKNRILRTGESQEADGRYKFRYIDANGKRKSVYSWRLVATDSIPAGKRDNAPLREQEKTINRDIDDSIVPDGGGMTVLQYLMGHSDISVTLNTYTHLKLDDAKEEMEKLALKAADAEEEMEKLGVKEKTCRDKPK